MTIIDFKKGTSFEPVTDYHLESIQDYLDEFFDGKELPSKLISLLKTNNGGTPIQRYFPTKNNAYTIRVFYNISNNETIILHESNEISDVHQFLEERLNNDALLPIAETRNGDVIVLDYEGTPKDNPRVSLWFHECDEDGVNSHPMEPIAENMESFLSMLTADFEE